MEAARKRSEEIGPSSGNFAPPTDHAMPCATAILPSSSSDPKRPIMFARNTQKGQRGNLKLLQKLQPPNDE